MSLSARQLFPALAAALAAATFAAARALAAGGGGGTPPPTETASYCGEDWVYQLPDGSTVFANEASGGGCVWG